MEEKADGGQAMSLWPHQGQAVSEVLAAIDRGERRLLLSIPTGGGKTRVASELISHLIAAGKRVVLYTNRKMLVDQTSAVLMNAGHYHGVRAAGYEDEREHPLQVSSIQTEHSRVIKRQRWELHAADLAIVDEAHLQSGETARTILNAHHAAGAAYLGLTATPIGLADLYDTLIVCGMTSELRECGALVPCLHYGPDEPDLRAFKKLQAACEAGENPSEKEVAKAMMTPTLFGRVYEWFGKLNPTHRPTILFAPGVRESIWFAEQFNARGITAAHIDGQDVWINGRLCKSDRETRKEVLDGSRCGEITVICNRFVLREGVDAPWLEHGIFATVFGSLQSYLQSGGRLLRAHPGVDSVTLQDHGGNWWRHGSLNDDRHWELEYTAAMIAGMRAEKLRKKQAREPMRCPQCARILGGRKCACGYEHVNGKIGRPVVGTDGKLTELTGDIFKPRRICQKPDAKAIWERMYYRSKTAKGAKTFRQAMALFAYENNWQWPDQAWPFMPKQEKDLYRLVGDVPANRLVPKDGQ